MKTLEELLKIKEELLENNDLPIEDFIDLDFVIELVESHIAVLNRESYWVDKHLDSLGQNIKLIEEHDQLKRRCVSNCIQD